ncbi:M48 family metalloprotease [Streptomyces sp. NRRL B-1347]|uniref:M48 family metalloprotease n=1 Tax=Streptomyces sp. NRRL B-1347 TaxID=1476877 RepID=UPI0004CB81A7|nr:M48 family metalloprotease [Streptomyces sp. NRRL B-1347]
MITGAARPTDEAGRPPVVSSGLWLRFVVTLMAVMASVSELVTLWFQSLPKPVEEAVPGSVCWNLFGGPWLDLRSMTMTEWAERYTRGMREHPECFRPATPLPMPVELFVVLVLLGICLAAYVAGPYVRIRLRRLVRAEPLPGIGAELEELRRLAGVRVRFLIDPVHPRAGGLAFGHVGRRYVLLERGLVQLFGTDRGAFRAVVLHELAHVRNKDVDIAHMTVIVWRVYLAMVVIPALLLVSDQLGHHQGSAGPWIQLGILAALVLLNHHAIARERELLADARCAQWGAAADLARVLEGRGETADTVTGGRLRSFVALREAAKDLARVLDGRDDAADTHTWRRLRRVFALHPSPSYRARVLAEPVVLLRQRPSQELATGLIVGLALTPMTLMTADLLRTAHLVPKSLLMPALAVPGLAVVTVPLGFTLAYTLWSKLSATWGTAAVLRTLAAGSACGAGLAIGELMVPQKASQELTGQLPSDIRLGYAGVLVLGFGLLTLWLLLCAVAWPSGRTGPYLGATAAAVLLTAWLPLTAARRILYWFLAKDPSTTGPSDALRQYVTALWPTGGPALALGALAVGVPLAGAVLRVSRAVVSGGAIRDGSRNASREPSP